MSEYAEFLESKARVAPAVGFDFPRDDLLPALFPFQRDLVWWALKRGRAAIFADTGLGKTLMQVEWARRVQEHVSREAGASRAVLIFAPLAVAEQTCREAERFGIEVRYTRDGNRCGNGLWITNYEMRERFDLAQFAGVVLDESSILKSHDGKTRTALIEAAQACAYRLSCTATPSPNDFMELANQAEFLGVMTRAEMLSMFFVHDSGETQKWRLRGHAQGEFWKWMSSWAAVVRRPSDLGYDDEAFALPPLNIHEHTVASDALIHEDLFPRAAQTLTEQRAAQRASIDDRVREVASMVNGEGGTWLVWCHLNEESDKLARAINGAVQVRGTDKLEDKAANLDAFSRGEIRVLVTKPSIAGFGMNWQHCRRMAFVGLSHSFEQFYQAVRRCWRFGQTGAVDAHLFTAEGEGQVLASIKRKESQHQRIAAEMAEHMGELTRRAVAGATTQKAPYLEDVAEGEGWTLYLGDCVETVARLEPESIDYSVFSPPFASLYTYSNSDRDMGNCPDDAAFLAHFGHLIRELYRVLKPGRLLSFHCMNLPTSKQNHGYIGVRDFRGDLIRAFESAGFIFHSEVCIWKDPVTAMQRTKALGLLYKQLRKDSAMSRQGIPDYVVTMRKPGENPEPVTKTHDGCPVERWQRYASPVWMDINQSRTLEFRSAREHDDERHICPLQLDVIERCIELWTNQGDVVLSPFAGIGSEGYVALGMNREFIGCELKRSYWDRARKHLEDARLEQGGLFA